MMVQKDKNQVYMCMSCGNCKRKDEGAGIFSFTCICGDFPIDAIFASRIEYVGCRTWSPAGDNYNEPYLIRIDEKHKTVEIGKWGKEFKSLTSDELYDIYEPYSEEEFDGQRMSEMILKCDEAYGV